MASVVVGGWKTLFVPRYLRDSKIGTVHIVDIGDSKSLAVRNEYSMLVEFHASPYLLLNYLLKSFSERR